MPPVGSFANGLFEGALRWINPLCSSVAYHRAVPRRKQPMQLPLQITFRHMDTSDAVVARIRKRAEELERFFDRIMSCRVVVACRHSRHQQGNLFRVRVDLTVPGREIAVGRDPAAHHAHEDIYVAIRDAFDTTRRLLEDYAR